MLRFVCLGVLMSLNRKRQPASQLPEVLSLARAARELSMTSELLQSLIVAGLVWAVELGGKPLIPTSEVRRLARIRSEIADATPEKPRRRGL
jgi:hypothetical protein